MNHENMVRIAMHLIVGNMEFQQMINVSQRKLFLLQQDVDVYRAAP